MDIVGRKRPVEPATLGHELLKSILTGTRGRTGHPYSSITFIRAFRFSNDNHQEPLPNTADSHWRGTESIGHPPTEAKLIQGTSPQEYEREAPTESGGK